MPIYHSVTVISVALTGWRPRKPSSWAKSPLISSAWWQNWGIFQRRRSWCTFLARSTRQCRGMMAANIRLLMWCWLPAIGPENNECHSFFSNKH